MKRVGERRAKGKGKERAIGGGRGKERRSEEGVKRGASQAILSLHVRLTRGRKGGRGVGRGQR